MSCPTCGHSMGLLCTIKNMPHHLCERCGTVKVTYSNGREEVYRPKLVDRCRKFARELGDDAGLLSRWESFGVAESITPPEDRPRA